MAKMHNAEYWIKKLNLIPHEEGGYFKEDRYLSKVPIQTEIGCRFTCSHIYFLVTKDKFSSFHKLLSDEIWHHYDGNDLKIHILDPQTKEYTMKLLGKGDASELFVVVPANTWFAVEVANNDKDSYGLVGCTVTPSFDYKVEFPYLEILMKLGF